MDTLFTIHCTDGKFVFVAKGSNPGSLIKKIISGDFAPANEMRVCFNLEVVKNLAPLIREGILYVPNDNMIKAELAKLLHYLGGGDELFELYANRLEFGTFDEFGDTVSKSECKPDDYPIYTVKDEATARREYLRDQLCAIFKDDYDNMSDYGKRLSTAGDVLDLIERMHKEPQPESAAGYYVWAQWVLARYFGSEYAQSALKSIKLKQIQFVCGHDE